MKAPPWLLAIFCLLIVPVRAGAMPPPRPSSHPAGTAPWPGTVPVARLAAAHRKPGTPRLANNLEQLAAAYDTGGPVSLARVAADEEIPLHNGKVLIVVEGDVSTLPAELTALGGDVDSVAGDRLSLLAPVQALRDMAALAGVRAVRRPLPFASLEEPSPAQQATPQAGPQVGSITSEGVPVLNAEVWHAAGQTGQGVKAAVLDAGFYNWTRLQASGDLPANIVCVNHTTGADCGNLDASKKHGAACAELMYDMAPGLETLYLYTFDDDVDIAVITDEMIAAGVDVASLSYGWLNGEPYDGSGFISRQVTRAKADGDIFWAIAAGNQRKRHWEGFYTDGDGDGWHDFDPVLHDRLLVLNYYDGSAHPISGQITVGLTWNGWPTTDQDYDLYLYQEQDGSWVEYASSIHMQDGDDQPTEIIGKSALPAGTYALAFRATQQNGNPEYLELSVFRKDLDERYRMEISSLLEPATADGAVAVAAFPVGTAGTLESFSSFGPKNPPGGGPFDPNACGSAPTAECAPGFAGPDLVSTVSYYPYVFQGTSAAAPQVAGAAALVQGANLALTADEIYAILQDRAAEPGTLQAVAAVAPRSTTQDPGWGWGRIYLGEPPGGTAVEMASFEAQPAGMAILLKWHTALEIDLMGFRLHRRELPGGEPVALNEELIPTQPGGAPNGAEYTWPDTDVTPGQRYEYRLEAVTGSGRSSFFGPVTAVAGIKEQYRVRLPLLLRTGRQAAAHEKGRGS